MTEHTTGTREEWLAARLELLAAEKELTRRGDELARQRRALPWVQIETGLSLRDGRRERLAGRPLPRALTAARLPLHVRARLQRRLSRLLGDRGRLRRLRDSPGQPRRDALGGVARSAREAAGLQATDGLELPVGIRVRERLQPRLRRLRHGRAGACGRPRVQLPRVAHLVAAGGRERAVRLRGPRRPERTGRPTRSNGRV